MRNLPSGDEEVLDRAPFRKRWPFVFWTGIGVAVVLVAAFVASLVSIPYYALTPGTSIDVAPLISVPKNLAERHSGGILLTDVELVQLSALNYLYFKLDHDAQVLPSAEVAGPASPAQYDEQGTVDMVNARQAATYVGLRALGYAPTSVPSGTIVYQPIPGSPAARTLAVGDVITSLNGVGVATGEQLRTALDQHAPGSLVQLTYHQIGETANHKVSIRLGTEYAEGKGAEEEVLCLTKKTSSALVALRLANAPVSCMGVELEQAFSLGHLPFPVVINPEGIIGPSAGLAFTLGLIERLDRLSLTDGRKIAATGTISINGTVGDVGGVAEKTIAVERAGATIFFVPPQEKAVALAHATPQLSVLAVSSLSQALGDLRRLGGQISKSAARS